MGLITPTCVRCGSYRSSVDIDKDGVCVQCKGEKSRFNIYTQKERVKDSDGNDEKNRNRA